MILAANNEWMARNCVTASWGAEVTQVKLIIGAVLVWELIVSLCAHADCAKITRPFWAIFESERDARPRPRQPLLRANCPRFRRLTTQIVRPLFLISGAHANTRRCTEKQAFGGLDAQTAVKRRDGGGSTCQVMAKKIVLAAARRSGVS
jgi:hypothetical protein